MWPINCMYVASLRGVVERIVSKSREWFLAAFFQGPIFPGNKVRVRSSILEGSFPVPDRVAFGKNLIFFMLCSGAFSKPHLWIRSAVCPIRLVLRPYAGGCVRPNPVQFQSRQSRQPAWNSTAKSARETKTAFRRETASCTLPMGQMH